MSRYYAIKITDPTSGQVVTPPGFEGLVGDQTYTSFVNNQTLPNAWNVELDLPVISADLPMGGAWVRIWGISLQEISQASDLNNKLIEIRGGMQKGLPLANPAQSGLLASGYILQAFGNWVGTAMTLDLIIYPGSGPNGLGTLAKPRNLVLNWKAGTQLSQALNQALKTAYPDRTLTVNISSKLVRGNDEVAFFPTLTQLAQYVRETSRSIVTDASYAGVAIVPGDKDISVYDGTATSQPTVTQINFQDIIGQPTWIESPLIYVKTVMRADLKVGGQIKLPQTVVVNTVQAKSNLSNQQLSFQGSFVVTELRHIGNYRQPSGESWVTVLNAAPLPASSGATS